jgi:hypothetical protein
MKAGPLSPLELHVTKQIAFSCPLCCRAAPVATLVPVCVVLATELTECREILIAVNFPPLLRLSRNYRHYFSPDAAEVITFVNLV